jgi:hypothetical protein
MLIPNRNRLVLLHHLLVNSVHLLFRVTMRNKTFSEHHA